MAVALVTGCSSGIGRAVALQLASAGVTTVATARKASTLTELAEAGCTTLALDVTDDASRRQCVEAAQAVHGAVDILINNAGYAEMGPVEQVPLDAWRRQFETNVLGPVALIQLLLPSMRASGRGRIVNVSSMGGEITFPGGGAYHASKYALEALSDALRVEVAPLGVEVVLIQPGPVASSFDTNAADLTHYMSGPYGSLVRGLDKAVREQTPNGTSPGRVAAVICRAALRKHPAARYRVGTLSRSLVLGRRVVPDKVWDSMMIRQFRHPAPQATAES